MHCLTSTTSIATVLVAAFAGSASFSQETRELDAHEHGVGTLNIAVDGTVMVMEFEAPGADIVGFEYEATSPEDLAAIEAAITTLQKPLELFAPAPSAQCVLAEAEAGLIGEEDHDDHDHDDHDDHDDHAEHADHDDHDDHADHAEHADHDDHDDHDDHAAEASHAEFHAHYTINCSQIGDLSEMTFAYFDVFPNALELEVQIITDSGAQAFEVERDDPVLDLRTLF